MCSNCFDRLIYKFEHYKDFEQLETAIRSKCLNGELEMLDTSNHNPSQSALGTTTFYKCNMCTTVWVLSTPEHKWRGYFLPSDQAARYHEQIQQEEKTEQIGCMVFLVIIAIVIVWILIVKRP